MIPAGFKGRALPLTAADLAAAASDLGVGLAKVIAVKAVESRGRGFHPETGRPIILYEPHVFSRRTGGKFDGSHPELSYPDWGTLPYPSSQSTRYDLLEAAMRLDESAALSACSWGLFQAMGYNFKASGFPTVQAFVEAMCDSEGAQLAAFVGLVKANPQMHMALRMGDWAGFARRYNGPGYAQHGYDQRLKVAFAEAKAKAAA